MECIGIKRCIKRQCRAVEVRSGHISQQTTNIVVETVNVNHGFWAATKPQPLAEIRLRDVLNGLYVFQDHSLLVMALLNRTHTNAC